MHTNMKKKLSRKKVEFIQMLIKIGYLERVSKPSVITRHSPRHSIWAKKSLP